MKITKEMIMEKKSNYSDRGFFDDFNNSFHEFFADNFAENEEVEYQACLNYLANNLNYCSGIAYDIAPWLIEQFGRTKDVVIVDGDLIAENAIFIAGDLHVSGNIESSFNILVGGEIKAGGGIDAGQGLSAGGNIYAAGGINANDDIVSGKQIIAGAWIKTSGYIFAGEEYGIYAGLNCAVSDREGRIVQAKALPKNLMCGEFVQVLG